MRVLFFGDIVGRTARNVVIERLPLLRDELALDFAVVNCENAAGRRLGYGGGFYDRTLAVLGGAGHHLSVIGIAYDGQKLDKIPVGPYDMPLDAVLCPTGLFTPVPPQN